MILPPVDSHLETQVPERLPLRDDASFAAGKIAIFQYSCVIAFLFLISGFFKLQVQNPQLYDERAQQNSIKSVPVLAPRGRILDRDGRVIVDNHSSFSLIFAPNTTSTTVTVPILSDLAVELNETIVLNLSNPTNGVLGSPGTITIIDDDLASVSFAAANFNVAEDAGTATVSVRLNAASGQTISVRVESRPGSAVDGADFISTNALLIFLPGQTNRTFNIPVLEDVVDEITETISLSLTNLTNGVIGVPAQSTVSILDNDQPFIFFSADNYLGFEDEFSIPVFVRLSKPYSQQVSASYTITGGSATPGIDYTILGTVIIPASTTNATITVFPINDSNREADETIRLRLTDIAGAAAGRTETTVTILDEDGAPRFVSQGREGSAFRATLRGHVDQGFDMYHSTNLTNWIFLQRLTNSSAGTSEFITPATGPQRFFKSFVSP